MGYKLASLDSVYGSARVVDRMRYAFPLIERLVGISKQCKEEVINIMGYKLIRLVGRYRGN